MAATAVDSSSRRRRHGGGHLLDVSGQAPAPSKDYHQVVVTEQEVLWRTWPITFRNHQKPCPGEKRMPKEDYRYDTNTREEIKRVLGADVEERVYRLSIGHVDFFCRLPREALLRVLVALDLPTLETLSRCNSFLRQACRDEDLWKRIYLEHHGQASDELEGLAEEIGWRTVFFTSRLQVQVLLGRRRKTGSAKGSARPRSSGSKAAAPAFLTAGPEHSD